MAVQIVHPLQPPHNCTQINHVNGIKTDNRIKNLEWVTQSENQLHAYRMGLQPSRAGESNGRSKLTDKTVTILKELYNSGKSVKEVSKIVNVNLSTVRQIIYGKTWKSNTTKVVKRDDRFKPTII